MLSTLHQSITNEAQKTKLKVGKTKAKPENFTDTSFRAKSTQPALACTCI
jgi:pre-rRNA-processing protein IPI1